MGGSHGTTHRKTSPRSPFIPLLRAPPLLSASHAPHPCSFPVPSSGATLFAPEGLSGLNLPTHPAVLCSTQQASQTPSSAGLLRTRRRALSVMVCFFLSFAHIPYQQSCMHFDSGIRCLAGFVLLGGQAEGGLFATIYTCNYISFLFPNYVS